MKRERVYHVGSMSSGLPPWERWFLRAAIAFTLASPLLAWSLSLTIDGKRDHFLSLDIASSVSGDLQVFYERGEGLSAEASTIVPIRRSDTPQPYRIALPSGTFNFFRIDPPSGGGTYAIARARLGGWSDEAGPEVPLSAITAAAQARITSAGPPLIVEVPDGSPDPQLVWAPPAPLHLGAAWLRTSAEMLAAWLGMFGLVIASGWIASPAAAAVSRGLARIGSAGAAAPRTAIAVTAALATLAAMYPVIVLGHSLVSPFNGGAALLYDGPPFTPGVPNEAVEHIRGTDIGAAMWAFVPYSVVQREAINGGEFPLWNRYNGAGRPLLGQGQSMIFDPLHWPVLAAPGPALGWDIKYALHRFVFAIGSGLAVWLITRSWAAGAMAAAMAPFAAIYLSRLNHPAQFTLTYAPFVLVGWLKLERARATRELAAAAAVLAIATALLVVSSPPKEAVVMLACVHLTGLLACLLAPEHWRVLGRQLAAAAAAGAVAVLLTAPHWLVFLDTIRQSVTAYDVPRARFASWPFGIAMAFGALTPGMVVPGVHAAAFAAWCASLAGGGATWARPPMIAAALGPALALAVAFGAVPEAVILRLPFVANIEQIDYTFLTATVALLVVAAGPGLAHVLAGRHRAAAILTAALSLVMLWALGIFGALTRSSEAWMLLLAAALGAIFLPVLAIAGRRWPAPLPVMAALVLAAAIVAPNGLHAWTGVEGIDRGLIQPRGRPAYGVDSAALAAMRRDQAGPARTAGFGNLLLPGSQALYRLEGLGGPDALQLAPVEELINAAGMPRVWWWRPVISPSSLDGLSPLLDLFGVRYLITARNEVPDGLQVLPTDAPDQVRAVRRPTAWPRAFFVREAASYRSLAEFMDRLHRAPGPFAMLDAATAAAAGVPIAEGDDAPPAVAADGYRLSVNTTSFHLRAPAAGLAVLGEAWLPDDFVATVNGRPAPYLRVNHAFKGVRIPAAGDYEIAFRYRPARLTTALTMAGTGVALLAGLLWASRWPQAS